MTAQQRWVIRTERDRIARQNITDRIAKFGLEQCDRCGVDITPLARRRFCSDECRKAWGHRYGTPEPRPFELIRHGTWNGYKRHRCRCEQCRDANRLMRRRERKAA